MFEWAGPTMDTLWHNGLAAIPLVVVAAAASRFLPCLPATRHLIWVTVLVWLVGSSLLPQAPVALIRHPASKHSTFNKVAGAKNAVEMPKPRRLTSRLAKKEAVERARKAAPVSNQSTPIRPLTHHEETSVKENSSQVLLPLRYAARAENSSPDKLARAKEAAGPRSLIASENKESITVGSPRLQEAFPKIVPYFSRTGNSQGHAQAMPGIQHDGLRSSHTEPKVGNSNPMHLPKVGSTIEEQSSSHTTLSPPLVREEGRSRPWDQWASAVLGVRDAVSQLPPLPRIVWLGGTAVLVLLAAVRVISFRRKLRNARSAPRDVKIVVESACAALGLRRAPQILMVDGRLSPMVWCGMTPKLILPTQLWKQLDDLGRKAVVFHELAHIRRLDHRTAWIESAIGMLYWWHPLVWWVRGRLHAEAENCCDAWVMTLLPRTRAAYATALLKTREYLSGDGDAVPAMAIGITPGRARLFARRLTMVMTESVRPRLSVTGISLVMLVAVCGWVASPARSCPKEEASAAAKDGKTPCPTAKTRSGATSTPCAKEQPARSPKELTKAEKRSAERGLPGMLVSQPFPAPSVPAGAVVVVPASDPAPVAGVVQVSDRNSARAKRVAELEAELERLEQKIESLSEALSDQEDAQDDEDDDDEAEEVHQHAHHDHGDVDDDDDDAPRAPRPPRAERSPLPPMPPMPPMPPQPGGVGRGPGFAPMVTPRPGQSWADVSGEKTTWRTYKLSKGKAEDFFKFMSRSDVPIWVRSNPEGIDIQANPQQQEIFEAFFRIVDPSEDRAPRTGFFGQFEPMLAYSFGQGTGRCNGNCERCRQAAEIRALADDMRAQAFAEAVELRTKARGDGERYRAQAREEAEKARARMRRHARDARSEARDQHEAIDGLERQSQALAEMAESYREQSQRIRERAESVNERIERDGEVAASVDAYRMHVESLERSAEELNRQAEELQREVETIEQRGREVEENAREMEEHAEELDQRADAVREAVQTLETGVQPTPELVESVLALVSDIEQLVPAVSMESFDDTVSAVSVSPVMDLEIEPKVEIEEEPSMAADETIMLPVTIVEPDSDEDN